MPATMGWMCVGWHAFAFLYLFQYSVGGSSLNMQSSSSVVRSDGHAPRADEMESVDTLTSIKPLSHLEKKATLLHQDIRQRLGTARDGNEVFRIAEDIPAINRCIDKAVSIFKLWLQKRF